MGALSPGWLWLLALVVGGCAARGPMRSRGLTPAPTTQEVLDAELRPRRVGVVVGIDDYIDPAFPDLRFAAADANAMADRLAAGEDGGFDEVVRLVGDRSTSRDGVLAGLRRATLGLRPEDSVVVYISGHGSRVPDEDRWRRFLLTRDSQAGDLERTAVDLSALEEWFGTLSPIRKALILDTCFSGDGKSVVRPGSTADPRGQLLEALTPGALDGGEIHLHATSPGRPSLEDDRLGHGVYTHFLLEALSWDRGLADLDRDGVITAWEAHDYARQRTMDWTDNTQVPEAILRSVGQADLVLVGDPEVRAQDRSVLYLFGPTQAALSGAQLTIDGQPKGAFPGAFSVKPGVRTITMTEAATGRVIADGRVRLRPGFAYEAHGLSLKAMGPAVSLSAALSSTHSPVLGAVEAGPGWGVEVRAAFRKRRQPARGLTLSSTLGVAGAAWADRVRPTATAHVGVGWSDVVGPIHLHAGPGASLLLVPTAASPSAGLKSTGWYLISFGPDLGAGVDIRSPWSLHAEVRPHLGALALQANGPVRTVTHTTVSLGLRRGW